jgi:hypothetical protein
MYTNDNDYRLKVNVFKRLNIKDTRLSRLLKLPKPGFEG